MKRGGHCKRGPRHLTREFLVAATTLVAFATDASGLPGRPWPSVLGSREAFSPEVSAAVERIWINPTLRRTVNGAPARAPLEVYAAFVDTPEVTAAAARFRNLGSYHVQAIDDDRYRGDDGDGARGFSHVLRRERQRRIIFSEGAHTGPFLGTVSGSALTVLDLELHGDWVNPTLTAYVHIDDRVAAALAQVLVASFGFLADQKLVEGLRMTAGVAEWAVEPSGGFCEWLAREPLAAARRHRIVAALPGCVRARAQLGAAASEGRR